MAGEEVGPYEYVLTTRAGNRINAIINSQLIKFEEDYAILGIVTDITDQKRTQRALAESEEKFRTIVENSNDVIMLNASDGDVSYISPSCTNMLGYTPDELDGKIPSIFHPDDLKKVKTIFEKNARGEKCSGVEYRIITKEGNTKWVSHSGSPIRENGKVKLVASIVRDVTERKQLEATLRASEERLREYSQRLEEMVEQRTEQLKQTQSKLVTSERLAAIGELAGMVGHDLRNPLTSIKGAAYFLKTKYMNKLDPPGKEMLLTIDRSIDYSNKIINDLLDYSRNIKLELSETTLKQLLQSALALVEIPNDIKIVDASADTTKVTVDVAKMNRVFVNLIKNAFEAMPNGGELVLASNETIDGWEISFEDTGEGISEDALEKLWTPLFTTKARGMGFGLPICKRIVDAHGGKIAVQSAAGKGTLFIIKVPVRPKTAAKDDSQWIINPAVPIATPATNYSQISKV